MFTKGTMQFGNSMLKLDGRNSDHAKCEIGKTLNGYISSLHGAISLKFRLPEFFNLTYRFINKKGRLDFAGSIEGPILIGQPLKDATPLFDV